MNLFFVRDNFLKLGISRAGDAGRRAPGARSEASTTGYLQAAGPALCFVTKNCPIQRKLLKKIMAVAPLALSLLIATPSVFSSEGVCFWFDKSSSLGYEFQVSYGSSNLTYVVPENRSCVSRTNEKMVINTCVFRNSSHRLAHASAGNNPCEYACPDFTIQNNVTDIYFKFTKPDEKCVIYSKRPLE